MFEKMLRTSGRRNEILARTLIEDARFDELNWKSLEVLAKEVNLWTGQEVVAAKEMESAWSPLGFDFFMSEKAKALEQFPKEVGELTATLSRWRAALRASLTRLPMRKLIGSLLLIFSAGAFGHADDWPTAKVQNVFSENAQYFVRIIPGTSIGDTYGFSGAPKGPFAHAEFYARQPNRSYRLVKDAELNNPVSPSSSLVNRRSNQRPDSGYDVEGNAAAPA